MIVTFKTKAYSNITLFGDVAVQLLKMMGQTGNVPGAIKDEDVTEALGALKKALDQLPESHSDNSDNWDEEEREEEQPVPTVSLEQRAKPLLELLEKAASQKDYVSWE